MNWCGTSINRNKKKKSLFDPSANTDPTPSLNQQKSSSKSKKSLHSPSQNNHANGSPQKSNKNDIIPSILSQNPYKWTVDNVSSWIKYIGYNQYCDNFIKEEINGTALVSINKTDFGQLGIYALGHTKNINQKIIQLKKYASKHKPRDPFQNNVDDQKSPYTFDQRDYLYSHPNQYSQDKARDKNTYWELWTKIVANRDFMLELDFQKMMSRSGLPKDDIDIIWKLATSSSHGRCSFDEFTSIMKLSHLAQCRIPLYIINVSKLIFYHPPLASTEFFNFSSIFSDLQKKQVLQNMVGFYNLPSQILDSDDRLMELEKQALRPYHPIHFEINAKVLIATFSNSISNNSIKTLEKSVLNTLKQQMGYGQLGTIQNKQLQHLLSQFYVARPSPKELGMTPAGPPPGPGLGTGPGPDNDNVGITGIQSNNSDNNTIGTINTINTIQQQHTQPPSTNIIPKPHNLKPYKTDHLVHNHSKYYQQTIPKQQQQQQQPMHAHSAMNIMNATSSSNYNHMNSNNNNYYNDPMQQQQQQVHVPNGINDQLILTDMQHILLSNNFWEEFRIRSDIDKMVITSDDKIRTRQAMNMISKLRNINIKSVKFTDEGVKLIANKTKFELMDQFTNNNLNKNDLLLIKAKILGLNLNDIDITHQLNNSNDLITSTPNTINNIPNIPNNITHAHAHPHPHPHQSNVIVAHANISNHNHLNNHNMLQQNMNNMNNTSSINNISTGLHPTDLYKGIVIEGLPEIITNDDENIRKLDSAVLNEFIVSHIEVVDSVLRITFANEVTHKNINQLRKCLKSFLKDDIKLDKKSMKNVSIIPHTVNTWKGETTEKSVEIHNTNQYLHMGMESITATPQQQQQQQQHPQQQHPQPQIQQIQQHPQQQQIQQQPNYYNQ